MPGDKILQVACKGESPDKPLFGVTKRVGGQLTKNNGPVKADRHQEFWKARDARKRKATKEVNGKKKLWRRRGGGGHDAM